MTPALAKSRKPRRPRISWLHSPLARQLKAPVVCIGLTLALWQLMCLPNPDGFPGPIQVITQTWTPYISQPFYDDGGTAKGLGLQILISLQRVVVGYS
ncbi:MAG: hypothetical protein RLZZ213_1026, partial [Cyanobacteriota bacterium]